jgi:hypothetical protein
MVHTGTFIAKSVFFTGIKSIEVCFVLQWMVISVTFLKLFPKEYKFYGLYEILFVLVLFLCRSITVRWQVAQHAEICTLGPFMCRLGPIRKSDFLLLSDLKYSLLHRTFH